MYLLSGSVNFTNKPKKGNGRACTLGIFIKVPTLKLLLIFIVLCFKTQLAISLSSRTTDETAYQTGKYLEVVHSSRPQGRDQANQVTHDITCLHPLC